MQMRESPPSQTETVFFGTSAGGRETFRRHTPRTLTVPVPLMTVRKGSVPPSLARYTESLFPPSYPPQKKKHLGTKNRKHFRNASENIGAYHQFLPPSAITTAAPLAPARSSSRTRFFNSIRNSSAVRAAVTRFRGLRRALTPGPEPRARPGPLGRGAAENQPYPIGGILKSHSNNRETLGNAGPWLKESENHLPATARYETMVGKRPSSRQAHGMPGAGGGEERGRSMSMRLSAIAQGALVPGGHTIRRRRSTKDLHNSSSTNGAVEKVRPHREDAKSPPLVAAATGGAAAAQIIQGPPMLPEREDRKRARRGDEAPPTGLPSTSSKRHRDGRESRADKTEKTRSSRRHRNRSDEIEVPGVERRSASRKSEEATLVDHGTTQSLSPNPVPMPIEHRTPSRRKRDHAAGLVPAAPSDPTATMSQILVGIPASNGLQIPQTMPPFIKGEPSTGEKKRSSRHRKHDDLGAPGPPTAPMLAAAPQEAERPSHRHSSSSKRKPVPETSPNEHRSSHRRHRSDRSRDETPQTPLMSPGPALVPLQVYQGQGKHIGTTSAPMGVNQMYPPQISRKPRTSTSRVRAAHEVAATTAHPGEGVSMRQADDEPGRAERREKRSTSRRRQDATM